MKTVMKTIFYAATILGYLILCTLSGLFLYGSHRGQEALNEKEDSQ
tara:strand:+ start:2984 stop:3121 length:138 start_codon:yes stop_codon:yes gene_type:complete